MISNNYYNCNNQTGNLSYGAIKDVVPASVNEKLPESVQNVNAQEIAASNGAVATAAEANPKTALATLPIYLSFVALRSLNDSKTSKFSFSADYDKTIFGKFAKFGDKISNKLSAFIPKNLQNGVSGTIKKAKNFVLDHSAIARSLTTPIKFENGMAISQASGMYGRVMYDNADLFEKGFKGKDVKALFKGDGKGAFWKMLTEKGIEKADTEGALEIVEKSMRELAQKPLSEAKDCVDDIINILSKTDEKAVIDKWGKFPIGKIPGLGKLLTLDVPLTEVANKTKASIGKGGKTALGCGFAKGFATAYEGFTSNVAGGKIAPIMEAYFLASAIMRAKDAPEGQRLATFMDEEAGGIATLFTLPVAASLVTKLGGMKYIGMGKTAAEQTKNVSKYREMISALNKKVDAGTISRGEYVKETGKIKDLLKGETKFWQKPFKALGKIAGSNFDKETIKPFIDDAIPADTGKLKSFGISVSNKVKSLGYKLKSGKIAGITPGGVLRFALVMFVFSPLVTKPIRLAINKIFGKPYDSDKEKTEQEKTASKSDNPFANMSDEECLDLISKNQNALQEMQNNPELMKELQNDPQKLYDFLREGSAKYDEAQKNAPISPALQNYINKGQTPGYQNTAPKTAPVQGMQFQNNENTIMPAPSVVTAPETQAAPAANTPNRTYIPSSAPADFSAQQKIGDEKFNQLLTDIDKTEQKFSKYL